MVLETLQVIGLFALALVAVLGWFVARRWERERFVRREKTGLHSYLDDTITEAIQIIDGLATLDSIDWDSDAKADALLLRVMGTRLLFVSREAFEWLLPSPDELMEEDDSARWELLTKEQLKAFSAILALEGNYKLNELQKDFGSNVRDLLVLGVSGSMRKALAEIADELQGGISALGVRGFLEFVGMEGAAEKFDLSKWRDSVNDRYKAFRKASEEDVASMLGRSLGGM